MKYRLFLAAAFIAPAILLGLLVYRMIELDKSLVLVNGTMKTFKSTSGGARSSRKNAFTLEEYPAVFQRAYEGWARINSKDRSDDLIGRRPVYESDNWHPEAELKSKNERQVSFYVAATARPTFKSVTEPITYFDLKFSKEKRSPVLHYMDLFSYVSNNQSGTTYLVLSLITTIIFLGLSSPVYNGSRPVEIYAIIIVIIHLVFIVF